MKRFASLAFLLTGLVVVPANATYPRKAWKALLNCRMAPEEARTFLAAQRGNATIGTNEHLLFNDPRLRAFGHKVRKLDARPFGSPLLWILLTPKPRFERVVKKVRKDKFAPNQCSETFASPAGRTHTCNFDLLNGNWLQVTRAYKNEGGVTLACHYRSASSVAP